jgi:carboxylesterase type B
VTDGTNLAAHGNVAVVSLNHRLNIYGLYMEEICGKANFAVRICLEKLYTTQ